MIGKKGGLGRWKQARNRISVQIVNGAGDLVVLWMIGTRNRNVMGIASYIRPLCS